MQSKISVKFVLLMIIPMMMFAVSCGKKKVPPSNPEPQIVEEVPYADASTDGDSLESDRNLEEDRLSEEAANVQETSRQSFLNEKVYFEYDSSLLDESAKRLLKRKAAWINDNPQEKIVIEGHCDERGTNDYNLALGDRRANSARTFLVDMGVKPSRLSTISYGEERLADPSNHSKNRRVQFAIE
ncbi:MAG: OmpA family protein [Proteobacteria bacterium]|nr:OmpA family protein [Pseudomonadota bacterium]